MAMASSDSSSGGNGDRDVFGSLPNTRPQRRSARRDRTGAKAKPAASGPASAGAAAQGKAPARTNPDAAAQASGGTRAKPAARAGAAAQAKPATRAKPAARGGAAAAAKPAAKATSPSASTAKPATDAAAPRASASKIPPAGYATPRGDDGAPHGAELVTTVVQAAGELAQIGLAAGGRALKSALGRLPRP
jgi:hypothetical protein